MAFENALIHDGPKVYADGNITASGSWELDVRFTGSSGGWYQFILSIYVLYDDGTTEKLVSFGDNSTNIYGKTYTRSGTLTKVSGKKTVRFFSYCNSPEYGTNCDLQEVIVDKSGDENDIHGHLFGSTFTLFSPPYNLSIKLDKSTTTSFTISASWTSGTNADAIAYITANGQTKSIDAYSTEVATFTGLTPNTSYSVSAKLTTKEYPNTTDDTASLTVWTYPQLDSVSLSLPSGYEHDRIKATAKATKTSDYDQYAFKLDSGSYSSWAATKEKLYSDLVGHSTHTITAKMKNTESGYESAEVNQTVVTWYDPIYSLSVSLVNNWFWYLSTKAIFDYQGGVSNIKKYEFSIGNESYQDKGTTNSYSKGSTTPGASGNLNYNTSYTCKVRLTDNHGRTKEASATFKTLDERPFYVDGQLREVKLIKPDGSVHYITPNLLSVIQPDNTVINMNKIINNDNRTEYK